MSDVFDELRRLMTRDRLLGDPRASGLGVSIAIVDSGIEAEAIRKRAVERRGPPPEIEGGVFIPGQAAPLPYTGKQSTPHGTTVADIVVSLAPQAKLYSADVFGPSGASDVDTVLRAIHWAVHEWKCHIVNLSLGVVEQRLQPVQKRQQLLRAIEDAYFRDVLVVAAAHNDHPWTRSYPSAFAPQLISVDKAVFDDPLRLAYRLNEQVEFQGHGKGYWGPFAEEPATSWAAPHLTGIAARLLSLHPGLKPFEIKTLLYWLARSER